MDLLDLGQVDGQIAREPAVTGSEGLWLGGLVINDNKECRPIMRERLPIP